MVKSWIGIAVLLAGCAWSNLALACSCADREAAGFIHAELARLPANARGALFLPPTGGLRPIAFYDGEVMIFSGAAIPLSPSSFSIKSDIDSRSMEVQLTWLDVERGADSGTPRRAFRFVRKADEEQFEKARRYAAWQPLLKAGKLLDISAEVRAAKRLLRVGPAGGFRPGAQYTVTYLGERGDWVYPDAVEHTIDSAALQAEGMQYALVADGAPLRRLLSLSTSSGSCGSRQPATVQDFHYVVADAAKPYMKGMLFFSEMQGAPAKGARFTPLVYQASLCGAPRFGMSALGMGRELAEQPCDTPGGRRTIRGWAGLLEVEDRLHRTEAIEVDFAEVTGRSCRGLGMLREALDARDSVRAKAAACSLDGEERRELTADEWRSRKNGQVAQGPLPRLTPQETPAAADLLALASDDDPDIRSCGRIAIARLFLETPVQDNDLPERFAALLKTELGSREMARIDHAMRLAQALTPPPPESDQSNGKARKLYERALTPALPALIDALLSGKSEWPGAIAAQIATLPGAAKAYVPVLLEAASAPLAAKEIAEVLEQIAPDDPAYRALLLRRAAKPALSESAALSYDRIAGKSDPQQAIALLTEAARQGSYSTIEALGSHGQAARASIPVLVEQLDSSTDDSVRVTALTSLLRIDAGQPEVAAAIVRYLAGRSVKAEPVRLWPVMVDYKGRGGALAAIEVLLHGPLMAAEMKELASLIADLALPPAQKRALLARVAKVTVK